MANNRCSVSPDYIFQENIYSSPIENRTRARHASGIKQTCVQHVIRVAFRRPFENPKFQTNSRSTGGVEAKSENFLAFRFFPRATLPVDAREAPLLHRDVVVSKFIERRRREACFDWSPRSFLQGNVKWRFVRQKKKKKQRKKRSNYC